MNYESLLTGILFHYEIFPVTPGMIVAAQEALERPESYYRDWQEALTVSVFYQIGSQAHPSDAATRMVIMELRDRANIHQIVSDHLSDQGY